MRRWFLLILLIALTACQAQTSPDALADTPILTQAHAATKTALPVTATLPPITPPMYDVESDISFEGVSFYGRAVGQWNTNYRPEDFADGLPPHYDFSLVGTPAFGVFPQMLILPAEVYPEDVAVMREVLEAMPATIEIDDQYSGIPTVPHNGTWLGLTPLFETRLAYIDFQNGRGVRFLTYHSEGGLIQESVTYTYQGLTNDNQWYISLIMPIKYLGLREDGLELPDGVTFDENTNGLEGDVEAYYDAIAAKLNLVAPDQFIPRMNDLDALVQSLRVEPTLASAAAAPIVPTPTAAMPVIAAPEVQPNTTIENITLYLDPALAEGYTVEQISSDLPYNAGVVLPPYTKITLTGFAGAPAEGIARIFIMPTQVEDEFDGEAFLLNVDHLRDFLAQRPTSTSYGRNSTTGVPDLPGSDLDNGGAVQQFVAQLAYLDFQNGTGVRFVTEYTMELTPIVNAGLRYVYQGLTVDGRYAVAAYFPISHPSIPDTMEDVTTFIDDYPAFMANYNSYAPPIIEGLENANAASFTPSLASLDALVQSIRIESP